MSPFAKEKTEGAGGGEEKEERGAALLRRRPVRLKAVVAARAPLPCNRVVPCPDERTPSSGSPSVPTH
jgi:hypothetical protein